MEIASYHENVYFNVEIMIQIHSYNTLGIQESCIPRVLIFLTEGK